ncbi:MAG: hypothetical protein ACRCU6_01395, partial [Fusobacteriaceae bacterium]
KLTSIFTTWLKDFEPSGEDRGLAEANFSDLITKWVPISELGLGNFKDTQNTNSNTNQNSNPNSNSTSAPTNNSTNNQNTSEVPLSNNPSSNDGINLNNLITEDYLKNNPKAASFLWLYDTSSSRVFSALFKNVSSSKKELEKLTINPRLEEYITIRGGNNNFILKAENDSGLEGTEVKFFDVSGDQRKNQRGLDTDMDGSHLLPSEKWIIDRKLIYEVNSDGTIARDNMNNEKITLGGVTGLIRSGHSGKCLSLKEEKIHTAIVLASCNGNDKKQIFLFETRGGVTVLRTQYSGDSNNPVLCLVAGWSNDYVQKANSNPSARDSNGNPYLDRWIDRWDNPRRVLMDWNCGAHPSQTMKPTAIKRSPTSKPSLIKNDEEVINYCLSFKSSIYGKRVANQKGELISWEAANYSNTGIEPCIELYETKKVNIGGSPNSDNSTKDNSKETSKNFEIEKNIKRSINDLSDPERELLTRQSFDYINLNQQSNQENNPASNQTSNQSSKKVLRLSFTGGGASNQNNFHGASIDRSVNGGGNGQCLFAGFIKERTGGVGAGEAGASGLSSGQAESKETWVDKWIGHRNLSVDAFCNSLPFQLININSTINLESENLIRSTARRQKAFLTNSLLPKYYGWDSRECLLSPDPNCGLVSGISEQEKRNIENRITTRTNELVDQSRSKDPNNPLTPEKAREKAVQEINQEIQDKQEKDSQVFSTIDSLSTNLPLTAASIAPASNTSNSNNQQTSQSSSQSTKDSKTELKTNLTNKEINNSSFLASSKDYDLNNPSQRYYYNTLSKQIVSAFKDRLGNSLCLEAMNQESIERSRS